MSPSFPFNEGMGQGEPAHIYREYTPLGWNPETLESFAIHSKDRYSGVYVVGVQGTGKSGLLQNVTMCDIMAGHAVIVIDPHYDLVDNLVAQLPDEVVPRVSVLDMTDEAYPFGLNLFMTGHLLTSAIALTQAIDRIMHVFEVLWPDIMSQQHLPRYLRACIITLFSNPGSTLLDVQRLLTNDAFRQTMLKNVTDLTVHRFWSAFEDMAPQARRQQIEPLIGRSESIFMGRSLVRNIVGQRATTVDLRRAIENKEIIFVKLPVKTITQDARLIGTMLVAAIHAALFSFADIPQERRPGVSLIIDEFQHFVTQDITELFTEGRKYGARLVVAHQFRNQLPDFLKDSTMTARTKVVFQTTPDDARPMAAVFPDTNATVRPDDITSDPIKQLLEGVWQDRVVQQFVDLYLRPMTMHKGGSKIKITKRGIDETHFPSWIFLGGSPPSAYPEVDEPTLPLNHLLKRVMVSGDASMPIPKTIVYGFANCGLGFYPDLNHHRQQDKLLGYALEFPAGVVEQQHDGARWVGRVLTGKDQLYHFLFHLRYVMAYLAQQPLGKKTVLSATDVATMITQIPRRTAFVRSGEDIGVIYTNDTLPSVKAPVLAERLRLIQLQTRQKYCRPRSDVETRRDDEPPAASSRSEVI